MHYLDNAATTQVHPAVADTIMSTMQRHWANPSSLYAPGHQAEEVLKTARRAVAGAMGVQPGVDPRSPALIFTGSGTEANNIAVLGAARARRGWGRHLVATGFEHPSVAGALSLLAEQEGFRLTLVAPGADGNISPQAIADAVEPKTVLVCAMRVNNETGAIVDAAEAARLVKEKNPRTAFHCDAVQAFTKLPLGLEGGHIDTCAVSAHKLHAPKGVGALYIRKGFGLLPPMAGGEQEGSLRPGTENTPYIAGFAKAVELAYAKRHHNAKTLAALHSQLAAGLGALDGVEINSPPDGWPGILNFSLPGVRSETMLHFLEQKGVYVSSGSACSRGEPSHTLMAMGLAKARVDSAIRASFTGQNTAEDVSALLEGLAAGLAGLARRK